MPDPFETAYRRLLATDLVAGLRARPSRGAPEADAADRSASQPPPPPPSRLMPRLILMSPKVRPRRRRTAPD